MNNIERFAEYQDEVRQPKVREKRAIRTITAASFADKAVLARPWLVPDLIPRRQVTLLSGAGASGKSLLALQLSVAMARGQQWLGLKPERGAVVYVGAEDDEDELHRRLVDIAGHLSDLADLHILPLAGLDAVLAQPEGRGSERLEATPLFDAIKDKVGEVQPKLVIIDTLADAFAGNENSRPQARQFVGLLRGLAIDHDLAVVVLAHPSQSGASVGTSGSTGWDASVRSRLFFERTDESDPSARKLSVKKSNYSAQGGEFALRWTPNGFVVDYGEVADARRQRADAAVDAKFLELLSLLYSNGQYVSHNPGPTFAPAQFAKRPEAGGINKNGFAAAMERLFRAGKIRPEESGPPSKRRWKIVNIGPTNLYQPPLPSGYQPPCQRPYQKLPTPYQRPCLPTPL